MNKWTYIYKLDMWIAIFLHYRHYESYTCKCYKEVIKRKYRRNLNSFFLHCSRLLHEPTALDSVPSGSHSGRNSDSSSAKPSKTSSPSQTTVSLWWSQLVVSTMLIWLKSKPSVDHHHRTVKDTFTGYLTDTFMSQLCPLKQLLRVTHSSQTPPWTEAYHPHEQDNDSYHRLWANG